MSKFRELDAEEDPGHDIFNPGVSSEQRRRASELLGDRGLDMFIEQRALDSEFRTGVLKGPDGSDPVKIAVSPRLDDETGERVVLCAHPLLAMDKVHITSRRAGQDVKLVGRLGASRPGRRKEDRHKDWQLHIARFFESS